MNTKKLVSMIRAIDCLKLFIGANFRSVGLLEYLTNQTIPNAPMKLKAYKVSGFIISIILFQFNYYYRQAASRRAEFSASPRRIDEENRPTTFAN
jgi:hypothetical protein